MLAEVLQKELPSRSGLPDLFTTAIVFMARFVADVDPPTYLARFAPFFDRPQ